MTLKLRNRQRDLRVPEERFQKEGDAGPDLDGADLHDRLVLVERFRRPALLNGSIGVAANLDFEILGVNAANANSVNDVEGGNQLTTAGADGDEMILTPHVDTKQSAFNVTLMKPNAEPRFETLLRPGASIADAILWAGLKLTGAEAVVTDDDQAYFRYEDDVNAGKFQAVVSIGGVDVSTDLGIAPEAEVDIHLSIEIDDERKPHFFIDGEEVFVGPSAMTAAAALKPFVGVAADGDASAKVATCRWLKVSRLYA